MKLEINAKCPHCHQRIELFYDGVAEPKCPECQQGYLPHVTDDLRESQLLTQCAVCGCSDLYRQKDFNRKIGVGLIVVGVCLAFFTYGISLLIVTLIDWALVRKVNEVGLCYLCHAAYRSSDIVGRLPVFDLVLHDHYRNVREANSGEKSQEQPQV